MTATVPKTEPPFDDYQIPPTPSTSYSANEQSDDKTAAAATTAMGATFNANESMEQTKSDVEWFGKYVEQRLYRQTDDLKRRKLESAIQETIAKTEKEFF